MTVVSHANCTFWSGVIKKRKICPFHSWFYIHRCGYTVSVCPDSFLPHGTEVSFDVCFLFDLFFHSLLQTSSTGVICTFHYIWNHGAHNPQVMKIKPSQGPRIASLLASVPKSQILYGFWWLEGFYLRNWQINLTYFKEYWVHTFL